MSKNSVEQAAYFRALGAKNDLDMAKFRSQVENELNSEKTTDGSGNKYFKYYLLLYLFQLCGDRCMTIYVTD